MNFAVLRGRELVRFEHDGTSELPPGAKRYPVLIEAKPAYDPNSQYLTSDWRLSDDGQVVGILYTVHESPPQAATATPPVIVERVERIIEQTSNDQVEALSRKLLEMQAAQRVGELILIVQHGTEEAQVAAFHELEPLAAARGVDVEAYVREWISKREQQTAQAMAALKGAA